MSAISGGTINITGTASNPNAQQALTGQDAITTVATINRDVTSNTQTISNADGSTSNTNISQINTAVDSQGNNLAGTLTPIFDQAQVQRELAAQVQITQAFSAVAPRAVGDYAQNQIKDYTKAQSIKVMVEQILNDPNSSEETKALAQNVLDQANALLNDPVQIAQYDH